MITQTKDGWTTHNFSEQEEEFLVKLLEIAERHFDDRASKACDAGAPRDEILQINVAGAMAARIRNALRQK